ncbi:hypothetical protein NLJ89_g49 [Agrocybe chaxingu]|uniref:Uncharacterized protein n=1 Tax=Agrocybe chaxingu TaxID=84603 RepID=A0A9W8N2K3_9AGAR|nr:hypothetical protein NLJ89_g49 [Agrocybe chaxingu]
MAMKRKLEVDSDEFSPVTKQLKLVPFPNMEPDTDVAMSDAEPLYPDIIHSRLHSNASSLSSASDSPTSDSSAYPTFDLYPMPFFRHDGSVDPDSHNYSHYSRQSSPNSQVGLLQPTSTFAHHGTNCTQIPKLRIACATTVNAYAEHPIPRLPCFPLYVLLFLFCDCCTIIPLSAASAAKTHGRHTDFDFRLPSMSSV